VPNALVIPHHNTFGKDWNKRLSGLPANLVRIGIDEHTAAVNDGKEGTWQVYGAGGVTVYHASNIEQYSAGKAFKLP